MDLDGIWHVAETSWFDELHAQGLSLISSDQYPMDITLLR